jgi:DNA-binding transcriptional regulator LsrR (DeoR family)
MTMLYEESLMVKVAWYYYFENMTQQAIAQQVGISRMRVVKLLEKARRNGIIQFKLRQTGAGRLELEREVIARFGLSDAFIIPTAPVGASVNQSIANAAALYIGDRLGENAFINIGYGDTPNRILNSLATMVEQPLSCVSLTGGVNYYLPDTRSNVFNAKLFLMPAPLLANSPEMAEAMRNEVSVLEISRLYSLASMSVVGIGSMDESATIIQNGILTKNDLTFLGMHGAVGDLLSHFVDKDGALVQTSIEDRLLAISLEALKSLPCVIGAAAGETKVEAIHGVLRGGYLNVLITDEATAAKLLRHGSKNP